MTPAPTARRWPWVVGAAAVIVLVAGAVAYRAAEDDDSKDADAETEADVEAGPGTELPDGLVVAPGSALIGPAVVDEVDAEGAPTSWFAVLLVDGDPIEVWKDYVGQIAELFPDEGIDPETAPGCMTLADQQDPGPPRALCDLAADTVDRDSGRRASAEVVSLPGDVTGHHLLRLRMSTETAGDDMLSDLHEGGSDPWTGDPLPEPEEARDRPDVGEPLAPRTVAYPEGVGDGGGDNERYVLLDGSELLAQYGEGSITGGFDVVLRVVPGADVQQVAAAYADQSNQFAGEPVPAPDVVAHAGTTVRIFHPPGGAGGYSAEVIGVDQPAGADDYVFYSLAND